MEVMSKCHIIGYITKAIEEGQSIDQTVIEKKSLKVIRYTIEVKDREYMIDEKGIKWVRAHD